MLYVQSVFQKIFTVLARTRTGFKSINVGDASVNLHLIDHFHKENIPIVLFVVKHLFFILTILITQSSDAAIKNAAIRFVYRN